MEASSVFHSFDEVPFDEVALDEEGDDSIHAVHLGAITEDSMEVASLPITLSTTGPKGLVVPHPRDLKKGMSGNDVLALKRALVKAQGKKLGIVFVPYFGGALHTDLKAFQRRHKLTADGVYGRATHAALAKSYDAYGIYLINHTVVQKPWRARVLTAAQVAYNERYKIHYTQGGSRMWLVRHHIRDYKSLYNLSSIYEDCSSFATWLYYQAGRSDPNGFGYNGLGFTGTLAAHGHQESTSLAQIGDLHLYGRGYPYSHVTINVGNGRCISHGSERGPVLTSVYYRYDLRQTRSYA